MKTSYLHDVIESENKVIVTGWDENNNQYFIDLQCTDPEYLFMLQNFVDSEDITIILYDEKTKTVILPTGEEDI